MANNTDSFKICEIGTSVISHLIMMYNNMIFLFVLGVAMLSSVLLTHSEEMPKEGIRFAPPAPSQALEQKAISFYSALSEGFFQEAATALGTKIPRNHFPRSYDLLRRVEMKEFGFIKWQPVRVERSNREAYILVGTMLSRMDSSDKNGKTPERVISEYQNHIFIDLWINESGEWKIYPLLFEWPTRAISVDPSQMSKEEEGLPISEVWEWLRKIEKKKYKARSQMQKRLGDAVNELQHGQAPPGATLKN